MSSGAGTGVVVEGGLEVGIDFGDEADEAEGGVAAATRTGSGAKPCTEVVKRKRSKISGKRFDLIAKRRERSRRSRTETRERSEGLPRILINVMPKASSLLHVRNSDWPE